MIWSRAALATSLAILGAGTQPGCALFASANAKHSGISPCVDDPTFAGIDLVAGSLGAAGVLASEAFEESPAWLALPGAVLLSGVIGIIFVHRCRGERAPRSAPASSAPANGGYSYDDASSPGASPPGANSPDEETIRNATPEEMGLPPPDPAAAKIQLKLDADYPAPGAGSAASPEDDGRIECGVTPPIACPPRYWCLLVEANRGYCVPGP